MHIGNEKILLGQPIFIHYELTEVDIINLAGYQITILLLGLNSEIFFQFVILS